MVCRMSRLVIHSHRAPSLPVNLLEADSRFKYRYRESYSWLSELVNYPRGNLPHISGKMGLPMFLPKSDMTVLDLRNLRNLWHLRAGDRSSFSLPLSQEDASDVRHRGTSQLQRQQCGGDYSSAFKHRGFPRNSL